MAELSIYKQKLLYSTANFPGDLIKIPFKDLIDAGLFQGADVGDLSFMAGFSSDVKKFDTTLNKWQSANGSVSGNYPFIDLSNSQVIFKIGSSADNNTYLITIVA